MHLERVFNLIGLLNLFAVVAVAGNDSKIDHCRASVSVKGVLAQENRFYTARGLAEYQVHIGDKFKDAVMELKSTQHWIDMGSGDGKALLERSELKGVEHPRYTGISYRMDDNSQAVKSPKIRFLTGRLLEEIEDEEIGQADLITDVYGVFSYASNISVVLRRYLGLLKPGGKVFLFLGHESYWQDGEHDRIKIHRENRVPVGIMDWINRTTGVTVKPVHDDPTKNRFFTGVIIEKTDEMPVVQPLHLLMQNTTHTPPYREYLYLGR